MIKTILLTLCFDSRWCPEYWPKGQARQEIVRYQRDSRFRLSCEVDRMMGQTSVVFYPSDQYLWPLCLCEVTKTIFA